MADGRTLLFGPTEPHADLPVAADCAELYLRRTALIRNQLDYRTAFWDDPRNSAAVFIGAIWTPGFYYLPFRAVSEFLGTSHEPQLQTDVDLLRAASAQQRCYER